MTEAQSKASLNRWSRQTDPDVRRANTRAATEAHVGNARARHREVVAWPQMLAALSDAQVTDFLNRITAAGSAILVELAGAS
jgi:hypothetical protein